MQVKSLLFPFRSTSLTAAGLDLNDQGLRWVELRQDERGLQASLHLAHCAFEPLAAGCIVGGEILAFDEVEAALGRLLVQVLAFPRPSPLKMLALAVPDLSVTLQRVLVPAGLNEADRLARAQLEVATAMRRYAADLCVDFRAETPTGSDTPNAGTALRAAGVLREAIEDRMALIEAAGLTFQPAVIAMAGQAGVLAACRVLKARGTLPQVATALVQLEPRSLRLDILCQGQALHSQRFEPAPALTDLANAHLSAGEGHDALDELVALVTGRTQQVWIAGPREQASGWAALLQRRTALPCSVVDAFDALVPAESMVLQSPHAGTESLVACGLALAALRSRSAADPLDFNFLPHRQTAFAQRRKSLLRQAGVVTLCVVLTSAAAHFVLSAKIQNQQGVRESAARDLANAKAELARLAGTAADMPALQRERRLLMAFLQTRQHMPELLDELGVLLPEGLHLTSLRRDTQGMAIVSGQAQTAAEVFGLIERLAQRSQHFKRPALLDLSLLPDDKGGERVTFSLQAHAP